MAEAIDYAHRKGIIHRDIKPANIIITTDGKVKIMDFGIAKIASSNLTTTGQFLGTPNYMSPEQVSGAAVDGRSDIFSLGVVLYELLTNRKPFQGENLTAISYKIVHEEFTPPADLSPEVPPDFNVIVARAMAKDPWNRYQRGKDLALALHQLKARLEEQRALQDSARWSRPRRTCRRCAWRTSRSRSGTPSGPGGGGVRLPHEPTDRTGPRTAAQTCASRRSRVAGRAAPRRPAATPRPRMRCRGPRSSGPDARTRCRFRSSPNPIPPPSEMGDAGRPRPRRRSGLAATDAAATLSRLRRPRPGTGRLCRRPSR